MKVRAVAALSVAVLALAGCKLQHTGGSQPVTKAEAAAMVSATRFGKVLGGYRNLIPRSDSAPLAALISSLSQLASDFCDVVPECDLNPVLVRKGSGDVRVVDALFVAAGQ